MGFRTKLQVLKKDSNKEGYVNKGWINDNSPIGDNLLKNSNIINGNNGIIFQDSFKNLWATGLGTRLQVLKANKDKNGYVYVGSWQNT